MYKVTLFKHQLHKYGEHRTLDFKELSAFMVSQSTNKVDGSVEDVKANVEGFTACHCRNSRRSLAFSPESNLMVLDFDCKKKTKVNMKSVWERYEGARILYTTPSHTHDAPRFRLLIPLSRPIDNKPDYRAMAKYFITRYFKEEAPEIDKASLNLVMLWALPCNGAKVSASCGDPYIVFVPPPEPVPTYKTSEYTYDSTGRDRAKNYVMTTIQNVREQLNSTGAGNRNRTVNGAGYSLGRLIPSGMLTEGEAISVIADSVCFQSLAHDDGLESAKKSMMSGIVTGKQMGKVL